MKLFRARDLADMWVGEDAHGGLVQWPAREGGWTERTPYAGPRRGLEETAAALARGTGWPGGGRGRKPRSGGEASRPVTIRASADERAAWESAAGDQALSEWSRGELNAAAARKRR